LKLFAFGTYDEFKANSSNLPPLDDPQALKLKQLTIVSLAGDSKVIPYETLLAALDLKDTRTLEDVIIEGMYAGLFAGKLDQKTKQFHVTETAGRDCKPGELADMISVLKAWVEVRTLPFSLCTLSLPSFFLSFACTCLKAEMCSLPDRLQRIRRQISATRSHLQGGRRRSRRRG